MASNINCEGVQRRDLLQTAGVLVLRAAPDAAPVKELPVGVLGQVSIRFVVKISYAAPLFLTVSPKSPGGG
jgi:hypothetical protein